jgi:putative spermidine/putrescine transport system substrate-binding protein
MIKNPKRGNGQITRRRLLKGAATGAGLAVGSGLVKGFPTVWAQNIKDVKLVQVGGSYSAIIDIGRQASKDLGFQVEMQTADHDALMNRLVNEPKTIDIADTEFFAQYYMVGRNIVQPIPLNKYKWWDKTVPIFTKGEYPDGRKVSAQGTLPYKVQYLESNDAKTFATRPCTMPIRSAFAPTSSSVRSSIGASF